MENDPSNAIITYIFKEYTYAALYSALKTQFPLKVWYILKRKSEFLSIYEV